MRLQAPKNSSTQITIRGHVYDLDAAGLVEIENGDHVADFRSHGFTDYDDPEDDETPRPPGSGEDKFDDMNRNELFAYGKAHGIRMATPINLRRQRELCRQFVAEKDARAAAEADAMKEGAAQPASLADPPVPVGNIEGDFARMNETAPPEPAAPAVDPDPAPVAPAPEPVAPPLES